MCKTLVLKAHNSPSSPELILRTWLIHNLLNVLTPICPLIQVLVAPLASSTDIYIDHPSIKTSWIVSLSVPSARRSRTPINPSSIASLKPFPWFQQATFYRGNSQVSVDLCHQTLWYPSETVSNYSPQIIPQIWEELCSSIEPRTSYPLIFTHRPTANVSACTSSIRTPFYVSATPTQLLGVNIWPEWFMLMATTYPLLSISCY